MYVVTVHPTVEESVVSFEAERWPQEAGTFQFNKTSQAYNSSLFIPACTTAYHSPPFRPTNMTDHKAKAIKGSKLKKLSSGNTYININIKKLIILAGADTRVDRISMY